MTQQLDTEKARNYAVVLDAYWRQPSGVRDAICRMVTIALDRNTSPGPREAALRMLADTFGLQCPTHDDPVRPAHEMTVGEFVVEVSRLLRGFTKGD